MEGEALRLLAGLPEGARLLVAVSGGADSVAALRLMLSVADRARVAVEAANCNFHLRGEEADRDSRFVSDLCAELEVRLHAVGFDTREWMRLNPGNSLEMACRRLRHDWFDSLMAEEDFCRLVTGHNSGDNAETLFLNLLRGAGVNGLKGMIPDDGRVLRPLLGFSRREILEYLARIGQDFVTDSSNLSSDYRRNFLRNDVLPLLASRWEGLDTALRHSQELLRRENRILQHFIREALPAEGAPLSWHAINAFPDPETLIFHFIRPFGGSSCIAAEIARSLPRPETGKRWHLASGRIALATRRGLKIE